VDRNDESSDDKRCEGKKMTITRERERDHYEKEKNECENSVCKTQEEIKQRK